MKLVKKANGYTLRLTKSEYFEIGGKLGFAKQAQEESDPGQNDAEKFCADIDPNTALEQPNPTGGTFPPKVFLVSRGEGMRYLIRKFNTTFYTVLARKADGTTRIYESLMGYKKYYGYAPYDPARKQQSQEQQLGTGTIKVWDRRKNGWSTIIIDNIEILKGRGKVYIVSDPTIGPVIKLVEEINKNQRGSTDTLQLNKPPVEEVPVESAPAVEKPTISIPETTEKPVL